MLERVAALVGYLPAKLRPAAVGAIFLAAVILVRAALRLPQIVEQPGAWLEVVKAVGAGAAGGAVGGLAFTFLAQPLWRLPLIGNYLAGVVTVTAYMVGIAIVAKAGFGESLIADRTDAIIFAVVTVFFGLVMGFGMRDRSDS